MFYDHIILSTLYAVVNENGKSYTVLFRVFLKNIFVYAIRDGAEAVESRSRYKASCGSGSAKLHNTM
jgi:hypothetical protein